MFRWIFVTALLLQNLGLAEPSTSVCKRILEKTGQAASARSGFWARTGDAKVDTKDGGKEPFAFGFDAELWLVQDMLRLASLDSRGHTQAQAALRQAGLTYDLAGLKPWLGVTTDAEVRAALKPRSGQGGRYTLLDLKPTSLKKIQHGWEVKSPYGAALRTVMQATFDRQGLPITVGWEHSSGDTTQGVHGGGSTIELEMKGSTSKPAEFRKLIKQVLYKNADGPETHFHLSIPNAAANPHQVLMAARALEMKITLEEALAGLEYDGSMAPYDASALAVRAPKRVREAEVGRGAVRVEGTRWSEPVDAADIEFRQWLDADHALENMRFMMQLVKSGDRLRNTNAFKGTDIEGLSPSNLHNSLGYAAFLLKDRLPARKKHIITNLEKFAKEIKTAKDVTPEMRKKVATFLREENVLKYFTIETFLEEE